MPLSIVKQPAIAVVIAIDHGRISNSILAELLCTNFDINADQQTTETLLAFTILSPRPGTTLRK